MRVEEVDLDARRIRVVGKTGFRYVLFPRATSSILRKYIGNRTSGYLFCRRTLPRELTLILTPNGAWKKHYYIYDPVATRSNRFCLYLPKALGLTRRRAAREVRKRLPGLTEHAPIGLKPMADTTIRYIVNRVGLRGLDFTSRRSC
jgi:hypothetical protein